MKDKTCILMGIDSSTKATGISVYANGVLTDTKLITAKANDSDARMREMIELIYEEIKNYKPDIVAIETPTVCRNQQTQRQLMIIFGAIYGFCVGNSIYFKSYRPSEWRSRVKDVEETMPKKRIEQKNWAIEKIKNKYEIDVNDDVAEAILIGEAYINEYS